MTIRALSATAATLAAFGLMATPASAQPASHGGRHGLVTTCKVRHHHASGTIANRTNRASRWINGYSLTAYGPKGYRLWTFRVTDQAWKLGAWQVMATSRYRVHRAVSCRVRLGRRR